VTEISTIAVHEIVQRRFPRPPPDERDAVAMAIGKAIDGTLSELGHRVRAGRKPTPAAAQLLAESLLDDALVEAAARLEPPRKEETLRQIQEVLRAYRSTEIFGLPRPRTRIILIEGRVGVYAQPDYWDGRGRFFEMKSFNAIPPPPEVALQMRLFQLAFPKFESVLICIDRHARPVTTTSAVIPPPAPEEVRTALRLAYEFGSRFGQSKVLEYMEGTFVRYALPGDTT
jgi:hypothetical protein